MTGDCAIVGANKLKCWELVVALRQYQPAAKHSNDHTIINCCRPWSISTGVEKSHSKTVCSNHHECRRNQTLLNPWFSSCIKFNNSLIKSCCSSPTNFADDPIRPAPSAPRVTMGCWCTRCRCPCRVRSHAPHAARCRLGSRWGLVTRPGWRPHQK